MALPYQDAFTGSPGTALPTYDGGWSEDHAASDGWEIKSGNVAGLPDFASTADDRGAGVRWTTDTPNDDQVVQVTLTTVNGYDFAGPACRMAPNTSYWDAIYYVSDDGTAAPTRYIEEMIDGTVESQTTTTDSASAPVGGDVLKLEAEGTTATPYINDVEDTTLGTHTVSLTGGDGGMWYESGSVAGTEVDDFEVDNLSGGPLTASPSDGLVLGDSLAVLVGVTPSDGLVLGDSVSTGAETASISDGLVLSDSLETGLPVSVSDGLVLGDQPGPNHETALSDGIVFGEDFTITTQEDTGPEGIVLGDSLAAVLKHTATASSGLVLGDSPTTTATQRGSLSDGLVLGESPSTNVPVTATDGLVLGDSVDHQGRAVSEGLVLGDSPVYPAIADTSSAVRRRRRTLRFR